MRTCNQVHLCTGAEVLKVEDVTWGGSYKFASAAYERELIDDAEGTEVSGAASIVLFILPAGVCYSIQLLH